MHKAVATIITFSMWLPVAGAQQSQTEQEPVNIVVFVADDLGATDIGPYGNSAVQTPNLDRLADESLVFSQAFASSPTCSPSRASIYTGLMPFRNGAHANHTGVKVGVQTLPDYLKPLGYRVALAGKYHVGPMDAYPFELIHDTNIPEPGYENKGVLWTDLNMEPVHAWLEQVSKSGDPFILVVNDHSPHVIWPEQPEYDSIEVEIPSNHIDTPDIRKSRARYYTDITKMDRNAGKLLESVKTNGLAENTVVIFTADQGPQWPFGKWSLYDYGIQVPLIVRWPGVAEAGTKTEALVSLVDLLPTAVEVAGGEAPDTIDGKSFLSVLSGERRTHREEIYATHTGDGEMNRSPARMLRTEHYKYILNLAPEVLYTTHMDRADDHDGGREYWDSWREQSFVTEHAASVLWRYHNRPEEEFYDLQTDPKERRNLVNDSEYTELLEKFRSRMGEWRQRQGDDETGPYEHSPRKSNEPIAPYIFE